MNSPNHLMYNVMVKLGDALAGRGSKQVDLRIRTLLRVQAALQASLPVLLERLVACAATEEAVGAAEASCDSSTGRRRSMLAVASVPSPPAAAAATARPSPAACPNADTSSSRRSRKSHVS